MYLDDIQAFTSSDRAQLFNQYFHSVFIHFFYKLPLPTDLPAVETVLSTINISSLDVFQTSCNLDPNKASGIDPINPALLKYCAESLTIPIQYLFTLSLRTQSLPQEWHTHCIVPVFKSGDNSLVKNYRPISLLYIVSKILEKITYF